MSISAKLIRDSIFLPSKWPMSVINIAFHYSTWKPPSPAPLDLALALLNCGLQPVRDLNAEKAPWDPCQARCLERIIRQIFICLLCWTSGLSGSGRAGLRGDPGGRLMEEVTLKCWSSLPKKDIKVQMISLLFFFWQRGKSTFLERIFFLFDGLFPCICSREVLAILIMALDASLANSPKTFSCRFFPPSGVCPRKILGHRGRGVTLGWIKLDFTSFITLTMTSRVTRATKENPNAPQEGLGSETSDASLIMASPSYHDGEDFWQFMKSQTWHVFIFVEQYKHTYGKAQATRLSTKT